MVEMGKNRHLLGSVLFGFLSIFKWRVLVLFGSFKKEGSSSVRSVRVRLYSHLYLEHFYTFTYLE